MSTFETVHEPLEARDVILGRTTHVRRVLPNKTRRMIGAWCFLDHYGPDEIKSVGGMWVPPHPHTGLQTVTWLFEGLGLHTDSLGSEQLIRPGQLNVMTAGHGICHAEVSPDDAPPTLHGVQLWVCLPDGVRDTTPPAFAHLPDLPTLTEPGVGLKVFVGSMAELDSEAPAFTPLVGAELTLEPGTSVTLPLDETFEYGVLAVSSDLTVDGATTSRHQMSYLGCGRTSLDIGAPDGGIAIILGGEPFEEEIVMWWNFIGRSHEEIVEQREAWNEGGFEGRPERYGSVEGFPESRLLAPPLPNIRLKTRGRSTV
jgi:redox-sensitive bicupin YhaK (pirin superfamily)